MWPFNKQPRPVAPGRSPDWQALYCRPTRLGVGTLTVVALLWLIGVNYQVNLAYLAAFWLLGFLLVAVLLNMRQLLALQIDVAMPQEVFAGGEAVLQLSIPDNRRSRRLWLCSETDFLSGEVPQQQLWQFWYAAAAPTEPFHWHLPALERGYLDVPPLRTASVAPFGICMVQCVWHWPSSALVFPAPIEHDLPQPQAAAAEQTVRRMRAGGDDLSYLQEHQEGMSLQHVAWKSYAKTGRLLNKRFEEPLPQADDTVISYRDYPANIQKERLAGLLCYRILDAERHNRPYTLVLPTGRFPPQHGQREMCLTALALW